MTRIVTRPVPIAAVAILEQAGVHPVLARLYAARGIRSPEELRDDFHALLPPAALTHAEAAAALLADHIASRKRILVVADFDCDGATACAVTVRALRAFGADVDYFVPNRFETGYGLSPQVVELVAPRRPHLLVTVDNGIASVEGVAAARAHGIEVLVTDHHLPGDALPQAACIVNPNQPGCAFPSKSMAGVGVAYYVMLALRAELRRRGAFAARPEPNLAALLDLVALGTVADVVKLDRNNRILVRQGLKRIRAGAMQPGLAALFAVAGRDWRRASTFDLGFALAPRLNAAGRLSDMGLGIECLLTDDPARAFNIAQELDRLNRERREVEAAMQRDAEALIADIDLDDHAALTLYDPGWHQGVIGILAGRLKDRHHVPVIAFARGDGDELKGSGRSIPGLHLRDALDLVSKRAPGLLLRFGGHAAAAGLSLRERDVPRFREVFESVVIEMLDPAQRTRTLETDGALEAEYLHLDMARMLENEVWGQGFPAPLFADELVIEQQRLVGERHLKLRVAAGGRRCDAMLFRHGEPLPQRIRALYRLHVDEYMGTQSLRLTLEHWEPASPGA
ncbi:MAG: single-stranded-DNA-specific exonuclease RecJ [Pseudomonadota bacterium]|mgnify:FL=1|nr:MAG: single-stranded-DNA-specific exonuclease RecJ [Pseudomonadota bacterium]